MHKGKSPGWLWAPLRDGPIARIEEYLDSGMRAAIKAAHEALSP